MNKLLLSCSLLAAGAGLTWNLHHRTALAAEAAAGARQAWLTQTQLLAQAQAQRAALAIHVQERREEVSRLRLAAGPPSEVPLLQHTNAAQLSPAESERLLAELGFNWRTLPDYVVVSKESLKKISVPGMKGTKLSHAACAVLAITPEERAALETTARELSAEYQAWAQANVRREEPTGDVLAKYSLNTDAAFSHSLRNRCVAAMMQTLGPERGELLEDDSADWMQGLGMFGGDPVTMTIKRYGSSDAPRLNVEISQAGGTISTDVSPYQPFPEAFRPVFPGGWAEVAQREGFELPKEFRKK